jgi:hypothetical protein
MDSRLRNLHKRQETLSIAISRLRAGADLETSVELSAEESTELLNWLAGEKYRGGVDIGLRRPAGR